jgi:exosortase A
MHADLQLHRRAAAPGLTSAQAFGAVAAILVVLFVVFAPTTAGMVAIWRRSETFTHGFLVVPAVLWMVWQRRDALVRAPVQPALSALLPLAAAGALWLLGELSSSLAPSQLGLVAMVPCVVAALFGWRWVRVLAFPLAFLFFAVPFGEFMVPTLIEWTADFTVAALTASGIPVYREANAFVIPSGRWSVVEACSGIRYLIASVMLGSLFAWIVYRSLRKRLVFIAAAIAVPLVANWLRAYGIVLLGHLSDNRLAAGVDHLIYGWLFFGVLMAAMFWIGARWRDDDRHPTAAAAPARHAEPAWPAPLPRSSLLAHGALVALAVLAWPLADAVLAEQADTRPVPVLHIAPANGWARVESGPPLGWMPDVKGAARTDVATFAKDGRTVSVVTAVFRNQRHGAKLVTSSNQLVHQDNEVWRLVDRATQPATDALGRYDVNVALIRGPGGLLGAAQWYWLGGERTVSDMRAKVDLARDRLGARTDTAAWVTVVTPAQESLRDAWPVLDAFLRDMGPSLQRGLAELAQ